VRKTARADKRRRLAQGTSDPRKAAHADEGDGDDDGGDDDGGDDSEPESIPRQAYERSRQTAAETRTVPQAAALAPQFRPPTRAPQPARASALAAPIRSLSPTRIAPSRRPASVFAPSAELAARADTLRNGPSPQHAVLYQPHHRSHHYDDRDRDRDWRDRDPRDQRGRDYPERDRTYPPQRDAQDFQRARRAGDFDPADAFAELEALRQRVDERLDILTAHIDERMEHALYLQLTFCCAPRFLPGGFTPDTL
jgi:hypothetical protein